MKKTDNTDPLYLKYRELFQWRSISSNTPFIDRLDYVCTKTVDTQDANDDLKRELSFYQQALSAAQYAYQNWKQTSKEQSPFFLSTDSKLVMLKDNIHMKKIQERHQSEQDTLKAKEQVKRVRLQKRFAKQTRHKPAEKHASTFKHKKVSKNQKNKRN